MASTSRLEYPLDHASHIPFLVGVGAAFPILAVVEFGSGTYSTSLFLNKKVFPKVEAVISVETDPEWLALVRESAGPDPRLTLVDKDPVTLALPYVDLVFVDNGPEQHKIDTIRKLAERCTINTIVVVHDAETATYRKEIDKFQTKFISEKFNPGTAICTNANFGEKLGAEFYSIDEAIRKELEYSDQTSVTNVDRWIEVMNG